MSRTLIALLLLGASVAGQPALSIRGIVTDTAGSPLSGAQITIDGRAMPAVVADEGGRFEIPDLPAGTYTVRAALAGFRAQTRSVQLKGSMRTPVKLVLEVGILIEAMMVPHEPKEAPRKADAIALVRLEGVAPPISCADLVVVSAVHDASVVEVWKGKLPKKIQILETNKGACMEDGRPIQALGGIVSRYRAGGDYVVLLTGKAPRFGGLGFGEYVFVVDGQTVSTDGFMGFPETMPLREFQAKLRQLAR